MPGSRRSRWRKKRNKRKRMLSLMLRVKERERKARASEAMPAVPPDEAICVFDNTELNEVSVENTATGTESNESIKNNSSVNVKPRENIVSFVTEKRKHESSTLNRAAKRSRTISLNHHGKKRESWPKHHSASCLTSWLLAAERSLIPSIKETPSKRSREDSVVQSDISLISQPVKRSKSAKGSATENVLPTAEQVKVPDLTLESDTSLSNDSTEGATIVELFTPKNKRSHDSISPCMSSACDEGSPPVFRPNKRTKSLPRQSGVSNAENVMSATSQKLINMHDVTDSKLLLATYVDEQTSKCRMLHVETALSESISESSLVPNIEKKSLPDMNIKSNCLTNVAEFLPCTHDKLNMQSKTYMFEDVEPCTEDLHQELLNTATTVTLLEMTPLVSSSSSSSCCLIPYPSTEEENEVNKNVTPVRSRVCVTLSNQIRSVGESVQRVIEKATQRLRLTWSHVVQVCLWFLLRTYSLLQSSRKAVIVIRSVREPVQRVIETATQILRLTWSHVVPVCLWFLSRTYLLLQSTRKAVIVGYSQLKRLVRKKFASSPAAAAASRIPCACTCKGLNDRITIMETELAKLRELLSSKTVLSTGSLASSSLPTLPPPPPPQPPPLQTPPAPVSLMSTRTPLTKRKEKSSINSKAVARPSITVEDLQSVQLRKTPCTIAGLKKTPIVSSVPVVSVEMLQSVKLRSCALRRKSVERRNGSENQTNWLNTPRTHREME